MKNFKLFIATLVLTVFSVNVWSETLFYEDFGSGTANLVYSSSTTLSATETMFTSGTANANYTGDGKVGKNDVNPSNTYTGASGNSGAWYGASSGTSTHNIIQIDNIKISGYQSLQLSFGAFMTNGASSSNALTIYYKIDDEAEETATISNLPTSTGAWKLATSSLIGKGTKLRLRFSLKTTGGYTYRLDDIKVTGTPSCTPAGTALSITSANTVKTGKTITLASTGGNGGTVKWSVTNGTGTASISNGILTAGNVGTVTVKAHQEQNGQTCETDAQQTVTITAITFTDYITECSSDPSISVSPAEITGLGYVYGSATSESTVQTFTVNGSNLGASVTVSAPTGFEVKQEGGNFADAVELTPADGILNKTISVRLSSGKTAGDYNGNVTVSSTEIDGSKSVALSATVSPAQLATPSVTATPGVHQITLSWEAVPNASSYQLSWNGGTPETVTSPVTKIGLTGGQSYSYSLIAVGSGNYSNSSAAAGNATAGKETFTVTWNIGANQETTANVEEGTLFSSLTPPTVADNAAGECANKFMGWATDAISNSEGVDEDQVSWVNTSSTISASNKDFYAVFATQSGTGNVEKTITLDLNGKNPTISFSDNNADVEVGDERLHLVGTKNSSNNSPIYFSNGGKDADNPYNELRIYEDCSVTFTSSTFNSFKSVKLWGSAKNNTASAYGDVYAGSTYVGQQSVSSLTITESSLFTLNSESFKITASTGQYRIQKMEITGVITGSVSYSNYITQCAPAYQIKASTTNGSILWSLNRDEFSSTIGKQPEGRTVYFQLQPDLHYQASGTPTSSDVDIEDKGSGIYSFTMPASAVTISAAFTLKSMVTVTFLNNGNPSSTKDVYVGEAIGELPVLTSGDACDGTSNIFMGWTIASIPTKQAGAPAMISSETIINTAQTYNAVWAEQTGEEPVAPSTVTPSATLSTYYANIDGQLGEDLRSALSTIISANYSQVSYSDLKYLLKYADTEDANGSTIIDIYSNCSSTVSGDAITWVSSGRGLNREHTIPQSWFNEQSPMVSDAFHVYSVEAVANGNRGNTPYGECSSGTSSHYTDCSESGKLGSSTYTGYTGTVYEPSDEYKGDIARGYFYMITRYMTSNFTQGSGANVCFTYTNGKAGMTSYMLNLMLKWHNNDPVSEKELIRNEVIYGNPTYNPIHETYKQNNRNPFIDYPELVDYIWGEKKSTTVSLEDLTSAYGGGSTGSSYTNYLTQCAPTVIEINSHPANVTCYQDDDASLAIVATVNRGTLSYQWQTSANGTDDWADIVGATEPTYKPSTTSIGTTYYRCVVTSNLGLTATSNVATVTVNQKLSNKYTITYAYKGWGTDPGEQVLEVDGGSTVTLPTLASLGMGQEGYNFIKWEMPDGTQHDPGYEFTMPTENILILAVLEEIQQTVSYTVNGSAATQLAWTAQPTQVGYWDNDLTAEYTITDGYNVSAAAVTVNDVALTTSEYAVDNSTLIIEPSAGKFAGDVSITLTIEPMQYTVTLDGQGATNDYTTHVEATFGQEMPAIATLPIKPGYTFQGYFDAETGGTQYYLSTGASAHAWDKPAGATLTAQWSTDSYGITYTETTNLTWGEKPATINIETDMLTANYTVTAGYEVTGMTVTVGGNAVAAGDIDYDQTHVDIMTTFSGAVVITPTVTPIHYTITYLKNDGSASYSTQEAIYMQDVTLKNGTAFNRKGYTIDHWETEDGQTSYEKGYKFTPYNLTSDLTLKAIWAVKESDWYTITFVDQMQDKEVEPIRGILTIDGFTFPTLEDKETPPDDTGQCNVQHYHFMGWIADTDKDNEITESNIIKGGTEVPAASVTANAMYYAIWATATIQ